MNNSKFLTRKRSNSCPEFGQITSNDYSVPIKSRITTTITNVQTSLAGVV
jgi:hypothetical protein